MSVLLNAQGLMVRFGGLIAVDAVSLEIPERRIHGIIGPNGAGKTTFFNVISGLVQANDGSIHLGGEDITALPPHRRAELGIRRTFQSMQLIPQFTVLENVLVGLHGEIKENYLTSLFSFSGRSSAEAEAQQRVVELLRFLGLEHALLRRPSEMTFAEQRFTEIARAIISRPRLLLLDEPAAGLSPSEVTEIGALLRRVRDEWGLTIILVEHVLSLVLDVSDVITVLDNGKVISEGSPAEVAEDPRVKAAYLGE